MTEAENKNAQNYGLNTNRICEISAKQKMHGYEAEIDDIIAEVYLALCNHTSKEGPPIYEKAWLYGTLKNLINQNFRDKYKKKKTWQGSALTQSICRISMILSMILWIIPQ